MNVLSDPSFLATLAIFVVSLAVAAGVVIYDRWERSRRDR